MGVIRYLEPLVLDRRFDVEMRWLKHCDDEVESADKLEHEFELGVCSDQETEHYELAVDD